MSLLAVQVEDLRCIRQAQLDFDSKLTLICGPNGGGKTSLLEAIFVLGRGRSFRTRQFTRVVRAGASALTIVGRVGAPARTLVVGVRANAVGVEAHVAGKPVASLADLALVFPVQIIDPNLHRLIEEGPSSRRRAMDWGVFHVELGFAREWRRYQRALRQRAAALRSGADPAGLRPWDEELCASGELMTAARERYVAQLLPWAKKAARALMGVDLEITLARGWPADMALAEALQGSMSRDRRLGITTAGPHRADLRLRVDGEPARGWVSRGQQKLLAAALVLAQLRCLKEQTARSATLLLDDPAAELDSEHLGRLMGEIGELGAQLIATATTRGLPGAAEPGALFHVKQGIFERVL